MGRQRLGAHSDRCPNHYGSLGQDVAGFGGYAMWNNHLYVDATLYRSEHVGGAQPNPGTDFSNQHPRRRAVLARCLAATDWQDAVRIRHLRHPHAVQPRSNHRLGG